MGLLDDFSNFVKTPEGVGLLSAAFGGLAGAQRGAPLNSIGRAGIAGLTGYANANEQQAQLAQMAQAKQLREMQLAKMKQDQADADALRNFDFGQFYKTPQQQALEANGGPTVAAANAVGNYQPVFDQKAMLGAMMGSNSPALKQQAMTALMKEDAPMVLKEGESAFNRTGKMLFGNPKNPMSDLPSAVKEFQYARDNDGFKGTFQDFVLQQKRAGATNVSVNTGNAFGKQAAEAIAGQLTSSIDSANSVGDQVNAANQILKALDSGKVLAGPGTSWKVAANQLFGTNNEQLANTRLAIQGMAKLVMAGRQSFKGQGQISDREMALVNNALSGDIDSMSVGEIKLLAEGAINNATYIHNKGKRASSTMSKMPGMESLNGAFDITPLPPIYKMNNQSVFDAADKILEGK